MEVGTLETSNTAASGFIEVNFDNSFDRSPSIHSQVQTFNGSDFVRTRQQNPTTNSFQLALEEEEANQDTSHATERVGYLALDRGAGTWNGSPFQAGVEGDRFTDEFTRINFGSDFNSTPQFLASLASYDGADPSGLRYQNLNANGVDIKVEEDQSFDEETNHTTEAVNFFAIDGSGSFSAEEVMGEFGSVTLDDEAITIDLLHRYDNPVVFMQPPSFNGSDPAIARLDNITSNSFRARIQEANYLDGNHTQETVSYFVFEAGNYQLADGTLLEVGTLNTNSTAARGFVNVNLESDFGFTPTIFSQVQTFNGSDFVRTRQRHANANSFQVALEEEEALLDTPHANERVGYLAIESSVVTWSGNPYQAGFFGGFDEEFNRLDFSPIFGNTPEFLGALGSYNGVDPAGLRYQNLGTSGVEVKVEEDQSLDSELAHAAETVNFLALEGSGLLGATVV